jgi:chorismate dehydratase
MLAANDAALVIGDPALQIDRSRYVTLDLAEEWIRFTGKPFVFAFWAIRQQALQEAALGQEPALCGDSRPRLSAPRSDAAPAPDLATTFQQSRDHGLEPANLDHIVEEWSPRLNLTPSAIRTYLTENIHYHLDAACLEGLHLFYRYAAEIGALPAAPQIDFLPAPKACIA